MMDKNIKKTIYNATYGATVNATYNSTDNATHYATDNALYFALERDVNHEGR